MKTKLLLSFLMFASIYQVKAQNIDKIIKPQPNEFRHNAVADSMDIKLINNLTNKNSLSIQNLPYPIIFIHGLDSNNKTWNAMNTVLQNDFNLTDGGMINVCLNFDGSQYTSNTNFYNTQFADIAMYSSISSIGIGDFYEVNFDINNLAQLYCSESSNSYTDMLSNESAIVKQGAALKKIIQLVLQKTGKNKVILMGHSMGGLTSREYLQNTSNWQNDGFPHVAKLATTGTPHGGSNMTDGGLFSSIDFSSEAIRDLKKLSVYLEGGYESSVSTSYYNRDINCNGISNDGLYITGLNQKNLFSDIDYSCVIGNALVAGDGAVTVSSANLNNANSAYSNLTQNIFSVFKNHLQLTSDWYTIMQAIDEPNDFPIAYGVSLNNPSVYYGFNSVQSTYSPYIIDYDDYKFSVTSNSNVTISINKPTALNLNARLVSSNQTQIGSVFSNNGGTSFSFTTNNLPQGDYYLEIYGTPTANTISQYTFSLSSTLSNPDFTSTDSLKIYPNPTSSNVNFDNSIEEFETATIINYLGQVVDEVQFNSFDANQELNLSTLNVGVYFLKFKNQKFSKTVKIIKQ